MRRVVLNSQRPSHARIYGLGQWCNRTRISAHECRFSNPSDPSISQLVNVYTERIHCQPLPLFDPLNLASHVRNWPQYLLWSFIALTARLLPDRASEADEKDPSECLRKARRELMCRLAESNISLEILQSLCLLVLAEISGMAGCLMSYFDRTD